MVRISFCKMVGFLPQRTRRTQRGYRSGRTEAHYGRFDILSVFFSVVKNLCDNRANHTRVILIKKQDFCNCLLGPLCP